MKALSIRQPWAWLIVNGHKDIENRTWRTAYRGPVLIHASKGMTWDEYADGIVTARYATRGTDFAASMPNHKDIERGGIVGVATLVDCIPAERRVSPWHMGGQFGFALRNARPLPFVPFKGALGFFETGYELVDGVLRRAES
ncbi:ASCH domain-containing protein [Burkholderia sp. Bp8990]|uniref:ASCH domain-containing protein n=1 Tax=Burkholderia sp. Bp8990 TaxID=2184552 RepID=UPI000F5A8A97|nr:ASCH domain-containing protein [Burkholderia sp. Bp8990]RQS39750.1 ASCH domain-containing protein [Burkholderia sp. Bp8990]